ncbi:MAG TPA: glycosyltransferase family 39 protein, partial [Arenimonas sp.]|nr:glycosyltransferase family 39 protein [Arenimonas sp.]
LRVAFLLPSLLAGLLTLWLVYDLGRRLWSPRIGLYAAAALFVCLQFGLQAKRGQIDMVLVALTTLSLWGILLHLLRGPDWRALAIGGFAAGLGTVTKGVGFLPLLLLLPWLAVPAATRNKTAGGWRWTTLPMAFVLGAGVWLGPMLFAVAASEDPALRSYAHEILFRQTAERYANPWGHHNPPWYFLQVIATLWLPGALLLPWLLPAWWRRLRRRQPATLLLVGWALLVLLFFSASPGKREVYILPALPALCLAAAPLLPGLLKRIGVRLALLAHVLLFATVALLVAGSGLVGSGEWIQRKAAARDIAAADLRALLYWMLALGLGSFAIAAATRLRRAAPGTVLFTALLWTVYGVGLLPAIDASSSAKAVMQKVGRHIGPDAELAVLAWREQHLLQADRPARDFGFRRPWHEQWQDAGAWLAADPGKRWLFVLDEALSPCVDRAQAVAIGRSNRRDWLLLPGTAWPGDCVTPPFAADDLGHAPR